MNVLESFIFLQIFSETLKKIKKILVKLKGAHGEFQNPISVIKESDLFTIRLLHKQ